MAGEDLNLRLSYVLHRGAINTGEIAVRKFVWINQDEVTDTQANQLFCNRRPDAATADDTDP
jgi:hypothetical protein